MTSNSAARRLSVDDPTATAVDPDEELALGPAHVEHDPPAAPGPRHTERGAVDAGRVRGRDGGRRPRERHPDVRVVRAVVALDRPVAGDVDAVPAVVVGVAVDVRVGDRLGRLSQAEAPVAVERAAPTATARPPGPPRRPGRARAGCASAAG